MVFGQPLTAAAQSLGVDARRVLDPERFRSLVAARPSGLASAQLAVLREVDAAVAAANAALASLDEARALRSLAFAETELTQALALPGAALFYAEVQLHLGVSAAQLGLLDLAAAAFARAARVQPERRLLAGEAAPEVVALATRAFEQVERAPLGEFPLAVNAPAARVFLDDTERGAAPLVVRARTGLHVLRIEAPGYVPYACMFDVVAGRRPEQRFVLRESASRAALTGFARARTGEQARAVEDAASSLLDAAPGLEAVAFAEQGPGARRGFVVLCDRVGCRAPSLRTPQDQRRQALSVQGLSSDNLRAARAWLQQDDFASAARSSAAGSGSPWQRWVVWPVLSVAAIAAAVSVGVAARPEPQRQLRVTVDPSALR